MAAILNDMGFTYTIIPRKVAEYASILQKCDVLLVNCAGLNTLPLRPVTDFVSNGGSVLASDWASLVLSELEIPTLTFCTGGTIEQSINATIVDTELRALMNTRQINLNFDLPEWHYATSVPAGARVLLRGKVSQTSIPYLKIGPSNVPLAFTVSYGRGSICFTSFHNHAQTTELERKLLSLLILAPIAEVTSASITKLAEERGLMKRGAAS